MISLWDGVLANLVMCAVRVCVVCVQQIPKARFNTIPPLVVQIEASKVVQT